MFKDLPENLSERVSRKSEKVFPRRKMTVQHSLTLLDPFSTKGCLWFRLPMVDENHGLGSLVSSMCAVPVTRWRHPDTILPKIIRGIVDTGVIDRCRYGGTMLYKEK